MTTAPRRALPPDDNPPADPLYWGRHAVDSQPTDSVRGTPPNPDAAISVRGLTKRFGSFTAVDGIDFDVARGSIVGFLGPNGSGKTTTIRMLTGTSAPDAGQALVLGEDVVEHPERVRQRFGYMSQKFALFEDMTVEENLRFYAGVYDLSPERFAQQRAYVLQMADLQGRENELTANLSVGWRQRLALGTATIHDPELLFLDEPTGGVDPVARRQFWDLLYELAGRGVTLFVTTHYMDEASHCNRLAFIYRGGLIAEGAPAEIRHDLLTERVIEVRVADVDGALAWLERAPGVEEAYLSGVSLHAVIDPAATAVDGVLPTFTRGLREAGFSDAVVGLVEPTLEDVFVNLVARAK
ncbi:MAG: ABC transporter ATP-binding protein [Micropruina sp.]|uniref:ABC transporter ATP-binding protein n=1 Tax=Micropruina sp. TaxID=2737536 RepID=UPI0039E70550